MTIAFLAMGCGSNQESDTDVPSEDSISERVEPHLLDISMFKSPIRPNKSDWEEGKVYTDTLEFIAFNDDYDYWFAVFKTKEGKEVNLNTSDPIEGFAGRNYIITWKVEKYYEAGEGDTPYYAESLESAAATRDSYSFQTYVKGFLAAYTDRDVKSMDSWGHNNVPVESLGEMGVYCIQSNTDSLRWNNLPGFNTVTSKDLTGHICEGFEGTKDGYYYTFAAPKDIPGYADMTGEGKFIGLELPEEMKGSSIIRLRLVEEYSWVRDLYFFLYENKWHYWIENNCGCSA